MRESSRTTLSRRFGALHRSRPLCPVSPPRLSRGPTCRTEMRIGIADPECVAAVGLLKCARKREATPGPLARGAHRGRRRQLALVQCRPAMQVLIGGYPDGVAFVAVVFPRIGSRKCAMGGEMCINSSRRRDGGQLVASRAILPSLPHSSSRKTAHY